MSLPGIARNGAETERIPRSAADDWSICVSLRRSSRTAACPAEYPAVRDGATDGRRDAVGGAKAAAEGPQNRRRVLAAGGTAALLAACAPGGSQQAGGDASKTKAPVTLQWQSSIASGDQTRQKNWDLLLDRFQEKNPHVTVQRAYLPLGDHYDKMIVGLAGGSMPDLFSSIVTRVQSRASRT